MATGEDRLREGEQDRSIADGTIDRSWVLAALDEVPVAEEHR